MASFPRELSNVGGTLYFSANDGVAGEELWQSNGTSAGTLLVADVAGVGGSAPRDFISTGSRLLFTAVTNTYGRELHRLNASPTSIALSNTAVTENLPLGTVVGTLSATDPDVGDTISFSLPTTAADNSAFTIVSGSLRTAGLLNFETKSAYNITVRATDQAGAYFEQNFTININNLAELGSAVQIGSGAIARSVVRQLVVDFDSDVIVDPGAFLLQKRTVVSNNLVLETVPTIFALSTLPSGATRATIAFSGPQTYTGGSLSDGYYQLTIFGASVRLRSNNLAYDGNGDGVAGGDYVLGAQQADRFFALFGDSGGDGLVGIAEFGQFRSAFGKQSTDVGYNPLFDFDSDGAVGIADFGQFRTRFGKPALPFN